MHTDPPVSIRFYRSCSSFVLRTDKLFLGLGHSPRIERFLENVFGQDLFFEAEFADGLAGLEGFLGEGRGLFVTDERVQAGDHREAFFDGGFAGFGIGFHFGGAEFDEGARGAGQERDAVEGGHAHDGHHNVELKLAAGSAAEGDGLIVTHHPGANLHHAFAHHGVDLAGHDGAAGLAIGEFNFVVAAARAAGEPANVVGDVEQRDSDGSQHAAALD